MKPKRKLFFFFDDLFSLLNEKKEIPEVLNVAIQDKKRKRNDTAPGAVQNNLHFSNKDSFR